MITSDKQYHAAKEQMDMLKHSFLRVQRSQVKTDAQR